MTRGARLFGLLTLTLVAAVAFGAWMAPREAPPVPTAQLYQGPPEAEPTRVPSSLLVSAPSVLDANVEPTPASEYAPTSEPTPVNEATPATENIAPPRAIAPGQRIAIPAIGVNAELVEMGITAGGALAVPDSPQLVAWYGFTGKPGSGGNAVMSGHVDYHNYGPAVFWDLKRLVPGDRISVLLEGGASVVYSVTASDVYLERDVPMREVLAPTEQESLTLITCAGSFIGGEYTHRLVVRAVRVE